MSRKMKRLFATISALILGAVVASGASPSRDSERAEVEKFNQFFALLKNYYIEEVESAPLIESAIRATLAELDPHSVYYSAQEMKSISESMDGEFVGVGIEYRIVNDTLRVVKTIAGAPAEMVGVKSNDRIISINGQSAVAIEHEDVPKLLKGRVGSRVEIGVLRYGVADTLRFNIKRDKIPIHTIDAAYKLNPTTGYIKVNRFGETTMKEFREAYRGLQGVQNLVVDLRSNGGGLLSQAVEMSNFFLPRGSLVVSTQGRGVESQMMSCTRNGEFVKGKVVVIIDQESASASEIVAGAIQDWDRGTVVGTRSFGKGLVQRQMALPDGSAVRITTAHYRTPSGRVIQRPYTNGKGADYYQSRTIECDSTQQYKTLRLGRTVYGGGGITPDVEIVGDTTALSDVYTKIIGIGAVRNYTMLMLDRERDDMLQSYPTFEDFDRDFSVTPTIIEGLVEHARIGGIDVSDVDFEALRRESELDIKALLARQLYSSDAFYRVLNAGNETLFSRIEELFLKKDINVE